MQLAVLIMTTHCMLIMTAMFEVHEIDNASDLHNMNHIAHGNVIRNTMCPPGLIFFFSSCSIIIYFSSHAFTEPSRSCIYCTLALVLYVT